jgi:colanic acid/amylovoran biosynthesis glycosyltransferase
MAGLKEKGVVFQYYILGDGPEKEHLSFLRNELDLENEVIFSGKVTSIDIENYFSRAHIYLQTSHAEGFSNACLEAQAFGLPCVVPAISGMSTCIENNKTGMIIEQRNEDIFIQSIIYVIQNLDIFESSYISSRVKEKFSAKNQRESWLSFFNHIFEEDMLAGRK